MQGDEQYVLVLSPSALCPKFLGRVCCGVLETKKGSGRAALSSAPSLGACGGDSVEWSVSRGLSPG